MQDAGVYGCATLVSSTGIDPDISEVYDAYMKLGNCSYLATMNAILQKYGVDAEAKQGNVSTESVVGTLKQGKGVLIYVRDGYNQLYTKGTHWIVLSDIRPSKLGSEIGYDIYALVSKSGGKGGHGWQQIETVLKNLGAPQFYYIDEGT